MINAHGECATGSVQVNAISPSGRVQSCAVSKRANSYTASFTPQQVGEFATYFFGKRHVINVCLWKVGILYEGEHIRGSPFSCQVFDASLVQVYGLDIGLVGQELKFNINASEAGRGNLEVCFILLPYEFRE
ncbi:unnamed protein product [Angiostrongylus costaricensis]|uniref:Uncharacterized protein n=1 Tax=Angiostrongylus costaricensis TaxID=334426 RepID=A0A0R3P9G2_ANGCS|nr:unnamed protein product [Angiostrongylus costaricensis]